MPTSQVAHRARAHEKRAVFVADIPATVPAIPAERGLDLVPDLILFDDALVFALVNLAARCHSTFPMSNSNLAGCRDYSWRSALPPAFRPLRVVQAFIRQPRRSKFFHDRDQRAEIEVECKHLPHALRFS